MALTHTTATRNTLADEIDTLVNTGTTDAGGDIIIEESAGPTTLATITFQNPAFGAASSGTITLAGVPLSNTASATGTANRFQIRNRDNTEVFRGTVTATSGGGDIELDNTSINSGQTVQITSLTYSASA